VRSDVNVKVLNSLRGAGVDIPYPQRVVRLVEPISSTKEATG
jgi:small-conductance mechanosensitive channel